MTKLTIIPTKTFLFMTVGVLLGLAAMPFDGASARLSGGRQTLDIKAKRLGGASENGSKKGRTTAGSVTTFRAKTSKKEKEIKKDRVSKKSKGSSKSGDDDDDDDGKGKGGKASKSTKSSYGDDDDDDGKGGKYSKSGSDKMTRAAFDKTTKSPSKKRRTR